MRTLQRAVVVALVLGGAVALPRGASAHALLIDSDPAAGATVGTPPTEIRLTFGEAPDPKLSTVRVLDSAGNNRAAGPVQPVAGHPEQLVVPLRNLANGVYTVSWRTVSAVDGHVAAGSYAFGVGVAAPPPGTGGPAVAPTSPSASIAATLARTLLYVGLIALFGAAFLGLAIFPRPPLSVFAMMSAGWVASMVGTVAVIGVQWRDAGVGLATILGSSIGVGAAERLALAIVASASVALLAFSRSASRWRYGLVAATASGAMLVDVLNGHAASGPWWWLQSGVQWLHIVGVGVWIGGLAALLLAVRGLPNGQKATAVRRFSTWAGVALGAVVLTGFVRALAEIQTFDALIGTSFGVVVILKTIGLGALAGLGATNRFWNVPAAGRTLRGLRRIGSGELIVGVAVLALTGLLANLVPPASAVSQARPSPQPVVAVGSDFGTSVRVRLVAEPGAPGFNRFTATVTDYDSGVALAATAVALRFQIASRPGIGASTLDLGVDAGRYAASGGNLSIDGIWNVTATVAGPHGVVEVPLVMATRVAAEAVDVNASAGAPTIYTVHLPGNDSVQVYLDPGAAGSDALHMTFFDPAGSELPIPSATLAISPANAAATVFVPQLLEPGHFVAEVTLSPGPLSVDLIGQPDGGDQLHAHLEIQVK